MVERAPSPATVGEALAEAGDRLRTAGSETPRLDAELLLGHVLGIDRTAVLAHPEAALSRGHKEAFAAAVARREQGEPVAYIRGFKEFYGLSFTVDGRALIPRPETELLVELALARLAERLTRAPRPAGSAPLRVADVGTGCGAVAVALAVALRRRGFLGEVAILATDRSTKALELALENAVGHAVADVVTLRAADLLEPALVAEGRFDIVVANLPYLPSGLIGELPVEASFEPVEALDGGPDGLDAIRRLLSRLPAGLASGGTALLEIGADQAEAIVAGAAAVLSGWEVSVHPDLAGQPRVVELRAGG